MSPVWGGGGGGGLVYHLIIFTHVRFSKIFNVLLCFFKISVKLALRLYYITIIALYWEVA